LATASHLKVNKVYSQPHTNQGSVRQGFTKKYWTRFSFVNFM